MTFRGNEYFGNSANEFTEKEADFEAFTLRSVDAEASFLLSRESLVNLFAELGYPVIYETLYPASPASAEPAMVNLVNFVAEKCDVELHNGMTYKSAPYSEGDLSYFSPRRARLAEKLDRSVVGSMLRTLAARKRAAR